jgi:hypothetical protein
MAVVLGVGVGLGKVGIETPNPLSLRPSPMARPDCPAVLPGPALGRAQAIAPGLAARHERYEPLELSHVARFELFE